MKTKKSLMPSGKTLYSGKSLSMILITLFLLIIAAMTNALKDLIALNQLSEDPFFSKSDSWKSKWESLSTESHRHWWYLGLHETAYKEKFPFSSTILVGVTDGWHLAQSIQFSVLQLIMAIHIQWSFGLDLSPGLSILFTFIVLKTVFSLSFQLYYSFFKAN